MSEAIAELIIQKAFAYAEGSVHFGFQGGEPGLAGLDFYRKFHENITRHNTKNLPVAFSFQTNGTLINKEWEEFFKKHNYLIGLSLDGIQEIHDAFRICSKGKPTYSKVLEGMKHLQNAGVDINALTVVTEPPAQKGKEAYLSLKSMGLRYLQFIPCIEPLEGSGSFSLSPKSYLSFLCSIFPIIYERYF